MKIKLSELEYKEKSHPGYLKAFLEKGKIENGKLNIPLADYVEINTRQLEIIKMTQVKDVQTYSATKPGDLLALLIYKLIGKKIGFCNSCTDRQKIMNNWGWMGCWKNREMITDWLIAEAEKRDHSFTKNKVLTLFKATFSEIFLQRIRPTRYAELHPFYNTREGKKIFNYVKSNLKKLKVNYNKLEKEKYQLDPNRLQTFLAYWETPLFLHSTKLLRRLFHPVVQIPKEFRKFLQLKDNREVIEIDFSQTFPTLLLELYDDKNSEEANRFKELLKGGEFYNFMIQNHNLINPKGQFMKFLFSEHAEAESEAWKLISGALEQFPILYKKIIEVRGPNFSVYLQNLEAEIFIEGVISKCMKKNIFIIPIHDGYLILEKDWGKVQEFLDEILEERIRFTNKLKKKEN